MRYKMQMFSMYDLRNFMIKDSFHNSTAVFHRHKDKDKDNELMMIAKMTCMQVYVMMTVKMTPIEYHLVFETLFRCSVDTAGRLGSAFE